MRSVNKVIIVGNLTRDPELKETQGGQAIATFGVATNREWGNGEGERKSSVEFHEVVAWARRAEVCHQILKKGNLVYIEGYLKTRSWDGEDEKKRFRTEVVIEDIIKLEKKPMDGGETEYTPSEDNAEAGEAAENAFGGEEESTPAEENPEENKPENPTF
jgi:single-strand DNA-binding protein